tara:strand:- start:409 stop:585 length:177 start_codon:yes stop_codon:yes gene_type:complete
MINVRASHPVYQDGYDAAVEEMKDPNYSAADARVSFLTDRPDSDFQRGYLLALIQAGE